MCTKCSLTVIVIANQRKHTNYCKDAVNLNPIMLIWQKKTSNFVEIAQFSEKWLTG